MQSGLFRYVSSLYFIEVLLHLSTNRLVHRVVGGLIHISDSWLTSPYVIENVINLCFHGNYNQRPWSKGDASLPYIPSWPCPVPGIKVSPHCTIIYICKWVIALELVVLE